MQEVGTILLSYVYNPQQLLWFYHTASGAYASHIHLVLALFINTHRHAERLKLRSADGLLLISVCQSCKLLYVVVNVDVNGNFNHTIEFFLNH